MSEPTLFQLNAQVRTPEGKRVKQLRKRGHLPAVLYGHGVSSTAVSVESLPFQKLYRAAGESTLVDLVIDKQQPVKVLIHDVSFDPVSGAVSHIDFYQVNMAEKITTEIPLKFLGEAPAVKDFSGVLVKKMNELKIECLPADLIHEVSVPLENLKTFDDFIYVRDLQIPASIKILENVNDIVATVIPPREEEVAPAATESKEDLEKIKVVGKKEGEEEGAEEGAGEAKAAKGKEKSAKSAQGGSGGKEKK